MKLFTRILATFAALCALVAPGASQGLTTIHVISLPIDAGAEVFYAKELGYFHEGRARGRDHPGNSTAAPRRRRSPGTARRSATATPFHISSARGKGGAVRDRDAGGAARFGRADDAAAGGAELAGAQAKDLDGKVVAGSGLGTISGFSPRAWIDQNGGDSTKVKFVELAFPAMQAALDAGRVDAIMIAEPFLTAARKSERVIASPYDAVSKDFLVSAYFAMEP